MQVFDSVALLLHFPFLFLSLHLGPTHRIFLLFKFKTEKMHEVSFQDKEKEHLTRLQDAEEMKVCPATPLPGPTCVCCTWH